MYDLPLLSGTLPRVWTVACVGNINVNEPTGIRKRHLSVKVRILQILFGKSATSDRKGAFGGLFILVVPLCVLSILTNNFQSSTVTSFINAGDLAKRFG
jgi:hypothetical protein